jgi:hypothetical protein
MRTKDNAPLVALNHLLSSFLRLPFLPSFFHLLALYSDFLFFSENRNTNRQRTFALLSQLSILLSFFFFSSLSLSKGRLMRIITIACLEEFPRDVINLAFFSISFPLASPLLFFFLFSSPSCILFCFALYFVPFSSNIFWAV